MSEGSLSWFGIVRLGLVQTALGSIVVLTTSALNRVMVVELALPAVIPGTLIAIHYFVQLARPNFGYLSDLSKRRTPWIFAGMSILAVAGLLGSVATAVLAESILVGLPMAVFAFLLVGIGVGLSGTSLLALLAARVSGERRAAAATVVWLMMIFGMAVTASLSAAFLSPFALWKLVLVSATVSVAALSTTAVALWNAEPTSPPFESRRDSSESFGSALAKVWQDARARWFTIFIFASMLAYSGQDLILEPFAGHLFGFSVAQSTGLSGLQHAGVFAGMLFVAITSTTLRQTRWRVPLKLSATGGCLLSALALAGLAMAGADLPAWPLQLNVMLLGFANGAFAVAAIAAMMKLASQADPERIGIRMGVWGGAQAIAFGLGGMISTLSVDVLTALSGSRSFGYSFTFAAEALLFVWSAWLAQSVLRDDNEPRNRTVGREAQVVS